METNRVLDLSSWIPNYDEATDPVYAASVANVKRELEVIMSKPRCIRCKIDPEEYSLNIHSKGVDMVCAVCLKKYMKKYCAKACFFCDQIRPSDIRMLMAHYDDMMIQFHYIVCKHHDCVKKWRETEKSMKNNGFNVASQCGECAKYLTIGERKTCSRCMLVPYCDITCQRKHWPKHKLMCMPTI